MEVSWPVSARAVTHSRITVWLQRSDDVQVRCQYEEWLTEEYVGITLVHADKIHCVSVCWSRSMKLFYVGADKYCDG